MVFGEGRDGPVWVEDVLGVGSLTITPNADGFGAQVRGLDLSRPLPGPVLEAVKAAFARHAVLWFPEQPLDHDQLEAFTLQWGAFGHDPYVAPLADRPPGVSAPLSQVPQETAGRLVFA